MSTPSWSVVDFGACGIIAHHGLQRSSKGAVKRDKEMADKRQAQFQLTEFYVGTRFESWKAREDIMMSRP